MKVLRGHVPAAVAHLTPLSELSATNQLYLAIGLPLRNTAELDTFLQQLYDPASTNYHRYLSPSEFTARFGPTEQDYAKVKSFAANHGFRVIHEHNNRLLLDVTAQAADVERAFHVRLNIYHYPAENRDFFAPDTEPSVDAGLPVLDVQGLSDFPRPYPKLHRSSAGVASPKNGSAPDGSSLFGDDFRNAYAPGVASLTGAGQSVGLFQADGFYSSDVTKYAQQAGGGRTNIVIQTVLLDNFNGSPGSGNSEVALDIEMAMSMAPGLSQIILFEGNPKLFIPNDILNAMAASNTVKNLSSSWGWTGGPSDSTDNIYKTMAAQGQSFFSASGDSDAFPPGYVDNSSNYTTPSSSPYITQVGGTTLTMNGAGASYASETVWNWGIEYGSANDGSGSSGGISSYYAIPSWQTNVSMALNHGSTIYRNIPDVALTADHVFVYYNNGSSAWFGGTSCAAPLWAGFMALVNQQAALTGKPSAGFINPAVYAMVTNANYNSVFFDTTTGNNTWSGSPTNFPAVAGYDLCTGLGSPNGGNFINAMVPSGVILTNAGWSLLAESAAPANGAIDPGETVTVNFALQNVGGSATSNLVATLLASTNILAPGVPQTYGAIAAFGGTTNKPFTFTVAGVCGGNVVATLQLQNGTTNLGTVKFTLPLGGSSVVTENFDGVTAPSLPLGWTNANVAGTTASWVTTTASSDTSPNSAFIADVSSSGENALVSPALMISSSSAQLSFRHNFSMDNSRYHGSTTYYDGGVLEIQIGNGAFNDILTAGGSFVSGGYNHTITTISDNPLGGRSAWAGSSGGWTTVTVNLPASAAGQTIHLRWDFASNTGNSGNAVGWYVDSVSVSGVDPGCLSVFTDIAAAQSLAANSLISGQNLVYTLSVTNLGPQAAANVVVTDTLPANVTFVSASPGCTYLSGQVLCPAGILAVNASTNFTVTFAPVSGNTFTNLVATGTVTPDFNSANNSSTLVSTQTGGIESTGASIPSGPVAQTIECGGSAAFSIAVTGTPPVSIQWSLDSVPVPGATNSSFTATNLHLPNHTVAVTVTNLYGSASSNALVTVIDTLAPVITLNGANPLYDELGGTFTDPGATASDTCAGTVPVSVSGMVNTDAVGTNMLFYTASDGNGNSATNTRTVIVRDTTPPTIVWTFTNVVLAVGTNTGTTMPDVTGTNYIIATDLSGAVTIVQNPTNNAFLPLGTNAVLLTAMDDSDNSAYSTNTITVVVSTNATPLLASPDMQGSALVLQLSGAYGSNYVLEAATDLTSGVWLPIATNTIGVDGTWQFTDPSVTNNPARFYRLRLVQ